VIASGIPYRAGAQITSGLPTGVVLKGRHLELYLAGRHHFVSAMRFSSSSSVRAQAHHRDALPYEVIMRAFVLGDLWNALRRRPERLFADRVSHRLV